MGEREKISEKVKQKIFAFSNKKFEHKKILEYVFFCF